MRATIKTQGQQFTITEGDILIVNRYPNTEAGAMVEIRDVLTAGEGADFKVGRPTLPGATVSAKILENKRGHKIIVFKKKKRKGYERKQILIVNRYPNTEAGAMVEIRDVLTAGEGADFKVGRPT